MAWGRRPDSRLILSILLLGSRISAAPVSVVAVEQRNGILTTGSPSPALMPVLQQIERFALLDRDRTDTGDGVLPDGVEFALTPRAD